MLFFKAPAMSGDISARTAKKKQKTEDSFESSAASLPAIHRF